MVISGCLYNFLSMRSCWGKSQYADLSYRIASVLLHPRRKVLQWLRHHDRGKPYPNFQFLMKTMQNQVLVGFWFHTHASTRSIVLPTCQHTMTGIHGFLC